MYEMLTGRLPFEGDSAVSIAIQHISSIPLQPREINGDVPAGLESITMRAMNPDLNGRYQSADVLHEDLENFRKNPDTNFDYSEREIIQTVNPAETKPEPDVQEYVSRKKQREPVPVSRRGELSKDAYIDNRRRARKVSTLSGILFVVVFIIAVFVFLWNYWLDDVFTSPETMTVPELTGGRLEDVLINPSYTDYYNIIPSYESSDTVEIGYIMAQTPAAGRTVIKNSERKSDLKVVVSSGDSYVIMPEVVNSEYRQAYITLQKLKLEIEVTTISSDEVTEGYVITSVPAAGVELKAGDKVYCNNRGKGIMLVTIGTDSLSEGMNIAAAHTDSPRLDIKPHPLYEDGEMAYLKTHFYGGVRKHQWLATPLELHGVVVLGNGEKVNVHVGADESDPVFIINDLLPHLAREQGAKALNEAYTGELLNILVGGRPVADEACKERLKLGVLQILN
jgi:hypothetical protein